MTTKGRPGARNPPPLSAIWVGRLVTAQLVISANWLAMVLFWSRFPGVGWDNPRTTTLRVTLLVGVVASANAAPMLLALGRSLERRGVGSGRWCVAAAAVLAGSALSAIGFWSAPLSLDGP